MIGAGAGKGAASYSMSVFIGSWAGRYTTGNYNTFIGHDAGQENRTGEGNTYVGQQAGFYSNTASDNVGIGKTSLYAPNSGYNVAIGNYAGYHNYGDHNVFIGYGAGYENEYGTGNVLIGSGVSVSSENGDKSNILMIDNESTDTPLIYGEFDTDIVKINGKLEVSTTTGALIVPRLTTDERNALATVNGMIIYNVTTNKFNFYENNAWVTKANN